MDASAEPDAFDKVQPDRLLGCNTTVVIAQKHNKTGSSIVKMLKKLHAQKKSS